MDEHAPRRDAPEPSDERLFAVFQSSQIDAERENALRELISRYQNRLYAFAYRTLHHAADAEDAVQEAFVRAIRYAQKFSPAKSRSAAPFRTWMYAITRSTAIDIARQRHPIDDIDDLGEMEDQMMAHPMTILNAQMDARMRVEPGLAALSPADQSLLYLVYTEDLSLNEVAEILGVRLSTVKVRLHRARNRLKSNLLNHPH